MGIKQWLGLAESAPLPASAPEAAGYDRGSEVELLRESVADLELMLEDQGWLRLLGSATSEFSREGLGRAAALGQIMAVQNPLMKRGLNVRQAYIWGQGCSISARSGEEAGQDVNAVIQAFMDDEGNQAAFFSAQAREENEAACYTDGNVFIALFTSPLTGQVRVRTIAFDEIQDSISNPEDAQDIWFYRRVWTEEGLVDGYRVSKSREQWYPARGYTPRDRPLSINGHLIRWDAPIVHVRVNALKGWKFGIGDGYAALQWSRAYSGFLGDWSLLTKALAQYAWRVTPKGSRAAEVHAAFKGRPGTAPGSAGASPAGRTLVATADTTVEAMPKTGATIDSDSGRPLAAMAAAGVGLPVTVLLSDPGVTGARATAETLDQPTELTMTLRRSLWADKQREILDYVIDQAIKAPRGPLQGKAVRDLATGQEVITLAGDVDRTVEITWPDLSETPVDVLVKAIVDADTTETIPPLEILKLLLAALGVKDVDEILEGVTDPETGEFIDPRANAGSAAVDAFNKGQDPAPRVNPPADDDDSEPDPDEPDA